MKLWCIVWATFSWIAFWILVAVIMPEQRSRAYLQGLNDGSHNYHSRCANIGGVMVDEGTLIAVHCRGLGAIDVKEIKKWLHS